MITDSKKFAIIYVFIAIGFIFITIFALGYCSEDSVSKKQHHTEVKKVSDSIRTIHNKVDSISIKVKDNEEHTKSLSEHIQKVSNDEKEINSIIDSSDIDANIKFLSDFLSKEAKTEK